MHDLGIENYRAKQIMAWLYKRGADSFEMMTDISKETREKLENNTVIKHLIFIAKIPSEKEAVKYLFTTQDAKKIETILIKKSTRATVCVSSQVGCPMGCLFCATGKSGFKRNLSTDEILSQILYFVKERKEEITNVVFMGMGEPLLNYGNLIKAIRVINAKDGMNMGIRRLTISTCGLPKEIRKLSGEGLEFNLSVSLNGANDKTRSSIMKVNTKHPIKELMAAVDYYIQRTNRRVTFEYVLIKGVNDTIKDAKETAALLRGKLCHVNLIPFNKIPKSTYEATSRERLTLFSQILSHHGVSVTIRKSSGSDVGAACGQLAGK